VRQANGLRGSLIHPGQNLLIPRLGLAPPQPERRVADGGTYVVQKHDTLWDISRSFSVSVDNLCAANNLSKWETIHPGQRLTVPNRGAAPSSAAQRQSQTIYRVRKGDTLYAIARKFRVSVSALKRANGINGSRIYPGDILNIPSPVTG
jgi:membrane-bound lytic murein transglycosylase D